MMTRKRTNERMTEEDMREKMRETVDRVGKLIFNCKKMPPLGYVFNFADMPMRVVRQASTEEWERYDSSIQDIWGRSDPEGEYFFEAVVAD